MIMTTEAPTCLTWPGPGKSAVTWVDPAVRRCPGGPAQRTPQAPQALQALQALQVRQAPMRAGADPVALTDLVTRAARDDNLAWDALVVRFAPLLWSICRKYRLDGTDADDISQNVWLQLTGQLGKLRDPAALPGWLVTVTRRECLRFTNARQRWATAGYVLNTELLADEGTPAADEELLAAERHAALREAFATLPPSGQRLITLLLEDPPLSYTEISSRLGIPVGSIGPTRRRLLEKLRHHPAVAALAGSGQPALDLEGEHHAGARTELRFRHAAVGEAGGAVEPERVRVGADLHLPHPARPQHLGDTSHERQRDPAAPVVRVREQVFQFHHTADFGPGGEADHLAVMFRDVRTALGQPGRAQDQVLRVSEQVVAVARVGQRRAAIDVARGGQVSGQAEPDAVGVLIHALISASRRADAGAGVTVTAPRRPARSGRASGCAARGTGR